MRSCGGHSEHALRLACQHLRLEQRAIGDILVRRGVVTPDVLEGLYEQQREKDAPLLDILVQTRAASETDVARALAAECGLPFSEKVDINGVSLVLAFIASE